MSSQDDQQRIRKAKDGDLVPVSAEFLKARCPMPVSVHVGCELDASVARAIGWTHMIQIGTRDRATGEEFSGAEDAATGATLLAIREPILKEVNADTGPQYVPRYSARLDDAFAAAEKVVAQVWMEDQRDWSVSKCIGKDAGWVCSLGCKEDRAFASTPALAICIAILKLKENTKETR